MLIGTKVSHSCFVSNTIQVHAQMPFHTVLVLPFLPKTKTQTPTLVTTAPWIIRAPGGTERAHNPISTESTIPQVYQLQGYTGTADRIT